ALLPGETRHDGEQWRRGVRLQPERRLEVGLAPRLAAEVAGVVARRQRLIDGGIPHPVVDAVDDAAQPSGPRAQDAVQTFTQLGGLDIAGIAWARGRQHVSEDEAGLQEVDVAIELERLAREVSRVEVEQVPVLGA